METQNLKGKYIAWYELKTGAGWTDQEPTGDNDDEQDDPLNLTPEDNNVDHENDSSRISPPLGKRKSLGETSKINKKRMSDIDKCIELVKSTIQAESSKVHSNPVQEKFNLLAATLKEIPQMKDYSDSFYIHVLEYLTNDHNREFFMALTTNHQKLFWLKSRDGTHISAVVSDGDGQPFRGRKGTKTWNVLASCSFNRLFTFVNVGYQGSAHDITVWRNCLTDPKFEFPHPPLGKYYLVDSGYPNTLGYLSPIKDKQTRCFGNVKGQWKILKNMPQMSQTYQLSIILSTFTLHNFIRLYTLGIPISERCANVEPRAEYSIFDEGRKAQMDIVQNQIAEHIWQSVRDIEEENHHMDVE
uniref:DDE Tnp4 domain-containing protein n=1 Tax=Chenopodium quinoa TaxID=63459 RepID=A0A803M811_CHEQI